MSGRVTVRLTHAQARAIVILGHVHADDDGETPRARGVFRRAAQAVEDALAAQDARRNSGYAVTRGDLHPYDALHDPRH